MSGNLVASMVRSGLYTRVIGKRIRFFQQLTSTMDQAHLYADLCIDEGTVVIAESQRSSRGRLGRTWISKPGNLYLSVVLYPDEVGLPLIGIIAALAVKKSIFKNTGVRPDIKWPNDILINGRKVAGILVESTIIADQIKYAIVGIGINISLKQEDLGELVASATSLDVALGYEVSRENILRTLLQELDSFYFGIKRGMSPIEEWRESLSTLSKRVSVDYMRLRVEGIAEDIDDLGNLIVKTDSGELVTLTSGDVTLAKDNIELQLPNINDPTN